VVILMGGSRDLSGSCVVFSNAEPNFLLLLCWIMFDETGLVYPWLVVVPTLNRNQQWLERCQVLLQTCPSRSRSREAGRRVSDAIFYYVY